MSLESVTGWAMRAAVVPAVVLAVKRREHRPIAALLLYAIAADLGLRTLREDVIAPAQAMLRARGGDPAVELLPGVGGLATDAYRVVWIGWPPAIAAVAASAFQRRVSVRLAGVTWLGASAVFVLGRACLVGTAARPVYLAVDLLALAIGVHAAVAWAMRRRSPAVQHVAAGACLLFQSAGLVAYRAAGPWGGAWDLARVALLALFVVLFVLEGGALWASRSSFVS